MLISQDSTVEYFDINAGNEHRAKSFPIKPDSTKRKKGFPQKTKLLAVETKVFSFSTQIYFEFDKIQAFRQ